MAKDFPKPMIVTTASHIPPDGTYMRMVEGSGKWVMHIEIQSGRMFAVCDRCSWREDQGKVSSPFLVQYLNPKDHDCPAGVGRSWDEIWR